MDFPEEHDGRGVGFSGSVGERTNSERQEGEVEGKEWGGLAEEKVASVMMVTSLQVSAATRAVSGAGR